MQRPFGCDDAVQQPSGRVFVCMCANPMSFNSSSVASGSATPCGTLEFGRTYVVKPKGNHLATVVWLHGFGDKGSSWSQLLETLPLPNIKWICPTAPTRPVAIFGGFRCTAWFDAGQMSGEEPDDLEGLDAAATYVANILSAEPAYVKLGIGGFSVGAAAALYSATCAVLGQYGNGNPYPINLTTIVGLSGWLPRSRSLTNMVVGCQGAADRAASLPILLCHGRGDDVISCGEGERCCQALRAAGFHNLRFRSYNGVGHYTTPEEMDEVCNWLTAIWRLHGSA